MDKEPAGAKGTGLQLFQSLLPVEKTSAIRDALAGFTLAAMNVPQALGYTKIAGTPVISGLYTLLLPLIAFAALGSSRYLVVAADSATAAILALNGIGIICAPLVTWRPAPQRRGCIRSGPTEPVRAAPIPSWPCRQPSSPLA